MPEIREIEWARFSPTLQAHRLCRYCDRRATKMKRTRGPAGRIGQWVLVCEQHTKGKAR